MLTLNPQRIGLYITALFIVCCILFPWKSIAHADDIQNVTVDVKNDFVLEPGKVQLFLNPGDTSTQDIYVTDRIPGTTQFEVQVEDIEGSQDPNQPVVILADGEKGPYSGKDFIVPDTKDFTLSFGQRITIPVTVTIPKDASPGGYYSTVLISNAPAVMNAAANGQAEGSTKIISRIGTLYFVRVNGEANESGSLEDFRIEGPQQLFYEKGPFTFQILFNNTGNVHLVPYGTVSIKNMLGKEIASLPVDAYFSLPDSLRSRDVTWDMPLLLGRYTATVELNRGYGSTTDTRTIVFWVLPWRVLLALFAAIALVALIIIFFLKNFELKRK